jgi:hypothetical protein
MKFMSKIIGCSLLSITVSAYAGFAAPTAHSRANCGGFNESVTWEFATYYWWRVESHHFLSISDLRPHHILNTGTNLTWRAAAYHSTEGYSSRGDHWYVSGYHFYYPNGREILDVVTMATDCDIYDGWWDH